MILEVKVINLKVTLLMNGSFLCEILNSKVTLAKYCEDFIFVCWLKPCKDNFA